MCSYVQCEFSFHGFQAFSTYYKSFYHTAGYKLLLNCVVEISFIVIVFIDFDYI